MVHVQSSKLDKGCSHAIADLSIVYLTIYRSIKDFYKIYQEVGNDCSVPAMRLISKFVNSVHDKDGLAVQHRRD